MTQSISSYLHQSFKVDFGLTSLYSIYSTYDGTFVAVGRHSNLEVQLVHFKPGEATLLWIQCVHSLSFRKASSEIVSESEIVCLNEKEQTIDVYNLRTQ
jgi:hypothetical protein